MNSNAVDVAAAFRPLKKPTEVFRLEIRWSSLTDLLFEPSNADGTSTCERELELPTSGLWVHRSLDAITHAAERKRLCGKDFRVAVPGLQQASCTRRFVPWCVDFA